MKKNVKSNVAKMILTVSILVLLMVEFTLAGWTKENGRYRYFNDSTGQNVVNNWLQTGNGFYYFDQNGYNVTGWYLINGKYYYFDQDGLMKTGFQEIDNKKYFLDTNTGQMVTGWIQTYDDGVVDYYYFDENGEQVSGWQKINNEWYYFYNGKCLVGTFAKINDVWFHFNAGGIMDTGWVTERGKMYYFNVTNGALMHGWIQDQNGNEYYLSEIDGSLTVNTTRNIAGGTYTFDATGKCIAKDTSALTNLGVGSNGNNQVLYGVNIGISPDNNQMASAITSSQQKYIDSQPLEVGNTTGPK